MSSDRDDIIDSSWGFDVVTALESLKIPATPLAGAPASTERRACRGSIASRLIACAALFVCAALLLPSITHMKDPE